jgi:hypothetical protein
MLGTMYSSVSSSGPMRPDDGVGVRLVARSNRQVADHLAAADAHDVEGADIATFLADGGGNPPERPRPVTGLGRRMKL